MAPAFSPEVPAAVDLYQAVEYVAEGIVSRVLLNTPRVRVVLFSLAKDQELTEHASDRRACVQILEGEVDFLFDGKVQRLKAGTLIHLPPKAVHAVAARTPLKFVLTLTRD